MSFLVSVGPRISINLTLVPWLHIDEEAPFCSRMGFLNHLHNGFTPALLWPQPSPSTKYSVWSGSWKKLSSYRKPPWLVLWLKVTSRKDNSWVNLASMHQTWRMSLREWIFFMSLSGVSLLKPTLPQRCLTVCGVFRPIPAWWKSGSSSLWGCPWVHDSQI